MTTETTENDTKEATAGAHGAGIAPDKAPSKKAPSAKKGLAKAQKSAKATKPKPAAATKAKKSPLAKVAAKPKSEGVREGSKTEAILSLLRRAKGATLAEIMEATFWQAHSVRGFISGTLGKKMGLTVKSEKGEDGVRCYSVKG